MAMTDLLQHSTKIIGIGKSYTWAWPNDAAPEPLPEPLVFVKPVSSFTSNGRVVEVPRGAKVMHEVELAVVIGKAGRDISIKDAQSYIGGYALALDMADGNTQAAARKAGYPWAVSKGLDTFTPIGRFIPKEEIPDTRDVMLEFKIDGEVRQHASTSGLIYTVEQLVAYVSGIFHLEVGDVILTGTPNGVGSLKVGDKISASMSTSDGKILDSLELDVVARTGGYQYGDHWLANL